MRPFAELGFDVFDKAHFKMNGLNTDRHMINQEEFEKLLETT